jgi:signal transduction histidine kinase
MRYLIVILLLFFMHNASYAQGGYYKNAATTPSASIRANIDSLNNIAHSIFLTFPDSAHKIAANALILSEKSNYAFGKGRSFLNLGIIYWSQSYYPISLFYLKSAIANLPKDQRLYLSDAYRALGRSYSDLKEYKQGLSNLDTSMYLAGNDIERLAEVYNERAYVYYHLKNYDKAIELAKYSLKLDRSIKAEKNIAVLYGHLSSVYASKMQYKTALADDDTAFTMSGKVHNRRLRAYVYIDYAVIYNKLGKFAKAINYAGMAIALADSIGVIDAETRAYEALVNSFELKNDLKTALSYQRKYDVVKDSLSILNKMKTVTLVQNYYELNSKMNGVALMRANDKINKARIRSQDSIIATLVLSVIVLMVILSATYYFYKQKKILSTKLQQQHKALLDQKKLIEVQTVNLQTVNSLKDKLLAVIGHDLRTPVANLSNIVEMFETGYLTTKEVHGLMKNINPIVKGAELTLINLVEWAGSQIKGRSVNSSNVDIFLLGVEMEQTFEHELQYKNIDFINNAYPGQGVLADENHLKVILRNLVSNAIKFTGDKGKISLTTIIEDNELLVSVEDNGKGMTSNEMDKLFYLNTHFSNSGTSGEKGTGIGLLLCKELVELNGGTLKVTSVVGKGSIFYFNLPLIKAYA